MARRTEFYWWSFIPLWSDQRELGFQLLRQLAHSYPQVHHRRVVWSARLVQGQRNSMAYTLDVSVVIPFADDEDVIGVAVRRLATHLRQHGVSFELIAVDEDSGDNSHAVLGLLRPDFPELKISSAPGRGRGTVAGAQRARGRVLWLVGPRSANTPLAPFGRAYRRVARGEVDLIAVDHRFVVCHRTRTLPVIEGVKGSGPGFRHRLVKRADARGLVVETVTIGGSGRTGHDLSPWRLARLLGIGVRSGVSPLDRFRW